MSIFLGLGKLFEFSIFVYMNVQESVLRKQAQSLSAPEAPFSILGYLSRGKIFVCYGHCCRIEVLSRSIGYGTVIEIVGEL